jgi:dynactin 1
MRLRLGKGVSDYIANVLQQANALVPLTMEPGNTLKSTCSRFSLPGLHAHEFTLVTGTPPWVTRVSEVKARAAVNVEAERRAVQLNDEIQALVRNLKSKDQNIQESSVKIELMERRMETVKKQADTINDLETELSKARKQERSYEEAIDQLQHDLDTLEQDNMKLKALANNPERQGLCSPSSDSFVLITGLDVCSVRRSTHGNGDIASGRKR